MTAVVQDELAVMARVRGGTSDRLGVGKLDARLRAAQQLVRLK